MGGAGLVSIVDRIAAAQCDHPRWHYHVDTRTKRGRCLVLRRSCRECPTSRWYCTVHLQDDEPGEANRSDYGGPCIHDEPGADYTRGGPMTFRETCRHCGRLYTSLADWVHNVRCASHPDGGRCEP